MRISLALGPRVPLSRQTAWGCFTTNAALPGFGSLVAGYRVGYFQAAVFLAGFAMTAVFGVRFIIWYLSNYSRLQLVMADDVISAWLEIWGAVRLSLVGMALCAMGWLWALATSLRIIRESRNAEAAGTPPRLT
jgi:hypothetical protein